MNLYEHKIIAENITYISGNIKIEYRNHEGYKDFDKYYFYRFNSNKWDFISKHLLTEEPKFTDEDWSEDDRKFRLYFKLKQSFPLK